jgi:hypothetical protein
MAEGLLHESFTEEPAEEMFNTREFTGGLIEKATSPLLLSTQIFASQR